MVSGLPKETVTRCRNALFNAAFVTPKDLGTGSFTSSSCVCWDGEDLPPCLFLYLIPPVLLQSLYLDKDSSKVKHAREKLAKKLHSHIYVLKWALEQARKKVGETAWEALSEQQQRAQLEANAISLKHITIFLDNFLDQTPGLKELVPGLRVGGVHPTILRIAREKLFKNGNNSSGFQDSFYDAIQALLPLNIRATPKNRTVLPLSESNARRSEAVILKKH